MGKPSPFQALVDRQLDSEPVHQEASNKSVDYSAAQAVTQSGDQSLTTGKSGGKSSSPDYQRLTVYLRRETILDLKRRIVGTNVELSDIVQDAVERWIHQPTK
jgi:hypothetical protein